MTREKTTIKAPEWMTDEQATAFDRGLQHAAEASAAASDGADGRIPYDKVVTFRRPAHLTNDYDPSYRPAVRS